jgi:hypothetical protein
MEPNDQGKDQGKKLLNLNIVSSRSKHRGFGSGVLDLNSVSGVIIDGDVAFLDMGAMHAKSKVEKLIRFSTDKSTVPNGRRCWVVWVTVDHKEDGAKFYAGVTACEMLIDAEARKGWKILAEHVNRMDAALKRKILVEGLNETEKAALKKCLVDHNPAWWDASDEALKQALG